MASADVDGAEGDLQFRMDQKPRIPQEVGLGSVICIACVRALAYLLGRDADFKLLE